MATVYCLDCDRKIVLNPMQKAGDRVLCTSCGSEFEIVSMDPPELEWLYEEYDDEERDEDDWNEDDWDEDDWDEDDEEEWEEVEEDWAWMIAKRQRLQVSSSGFRRRRHQDFDHE
jgi:hypothetical protein